MISRRDKVNKERLINQVSGEDMQNAGDQFDHWAGGGLPLLLQKRQRVLLRLLFAVRQQTQLKGREVLQAYH